MSVTRSTAGFAVMEHVEDWEQPLALVTGDGLPEDGVLDWRASKAKPAAVFLSRSDARAAIQRTHHYAAAFSRSNLPEKRNCKVVTVETITIGGES